MHLFINASQIDCSTGKEYSYPQLKKDVLAMATSFQNENIGHGDIVMTTDYGSYEGQVVILAGLLVGATIGALDYNLRKGKIYCKYLNIIRPSNMERGN